MKGVKSILLMAGQGDRFGHPLPKQFHILEGKKIFQWTLDRLLQSGLFEEIILVCPEDRKEEIEVFDNVRVVVGGATRQESSYRGLLACGEETEIVLIHDAVRPFVSQKILEENIHAARLYGAVDTCIASADTLVYAPKGDQIEEIPLRAHFLRGQTPQTFKYGLIREAHERGQKRDATDDCQLVLDLGFPVHIVKGEESNLKITTAMDLVIAERIVQNLRLDGLEPSTLSLKVKCSTN